MAGIFYRLIKKYTTTALGFYYSKWQIHGRENIPDGPVIFVPNHQNAFLDAVLVTCSSFKNPWFLTRANVFSVPVVKWLLNQLQMLPVYRFRDGYATLKKNEQVMNEIVIKINKGASVLIFAEGNHSDKLQLRPLQKGVARIAMSVNPDLNVAIIPTALQYESKTDFRSRVLVSFGKPVYVNQMDFSHTHPQDRYDTLLFEIRKKILPLMLHIENTGYEEKMDYLAKHRSFHDDLVVQLKSDQAIIEAFPQHLHAGSQNLSISKMKSFLRVYIKINSILSLLISHKLLPGMIKDPQFTGSVRFASGMIFTPLFWFIQSIGVFILFDSFLLAAGYLITLPLAVKFS